MDKLTITIKRGQAYNQKLEKVSGHLERMMPKIRWYRSMSMSSTNDIVNGTKFFFFSTFPFFHRLNYSSFIVLIIIITHKKKYNHLDQT